VLKSAESVQVPPFWQGLVLQGNATAVSQFVPVKPELQAQV